MRSKALALLLPLVMLVLVFPGVASAVSFTVLHSFSGADGETPAAPLIQATDGFYYGVAAHGGDFTVLPPDAPRSLTLPAHPPLPNRTTPAPPRRSFRHPQVGGMRSNRSVCEPHTPGSYSSSGDESRP